MKGLEEYIKVHGNHFTEELAAKACSDLNIYKWTNEQIKNSINKKVYFNVTGATIGDVIYMINLAGAGYLSEEVHSKSECVNYVLSIIGDLSKYDGMIFASWVSGMDFKEINFDFTQYI